MAEVDEFGVIAKYNAGCSRVMINVDELPADILVFPVILIAYNLFVRVGQSILLDKVCAKMLFPLKSKRVT